MSRVAAITLLFAIPILVTANDEQANRKQKNVPKQSPSASSRQAQLVQTLNKSIALEQSFEGVPLVEVLEFLSDRYDIAILLNQHAFREVNGEQNIRETAVRVPKLPASRLRSVLEFALDQVNGTFLVKGDQLEVVPKARAIREVFNKEAFDEGELHRRELPLVNIVAERVPLEAVLSDLADQSGRNVVLDPRLKDQARIPVTIRLLNTPIDSAVSILARFHDLTVTTIDNTYIVTNVGGS